MDDYRLKTDVVHGLPPSSEDNLAQHLTSGGRVSPSWDDVQAYARPRPGQRPTAEPSRMDGAIRRVATPLAAAIASLLRQVRPLATGSPGGPLETPDLLDLASGAQGDRDDGQLRRGTPGLFRDSIPRSATRRRPPSEGAIAAVRILGRPPHRDASAGDAVPEPEPRGGRGSRARSARRIALEKAVARARERLEPALARFHLTVSRRTPRRREPVLGRADPARKRIRLRTMAASSRSRPSL